MFVMREILTVIYYYAYIGTVDAGSTVTRYKVPKHRG